MKRAEELKLLNDTADAKVTVDMRNAPSSTTDARPNSKWNNFSLLIVLFIVNLLSTLPYVRNFYILLMCVIVASFAAYFMNQIISL